MPTWSVYTDPWPTWHLTTNTTASTTLGIWNTWSTSGGSTGGTITYTGNATTYRAAREAELAEHNQRVAETRAVREAASARASETLQLVLTDEQWAAWVADDRFELTGSAGGHYRIRRGVSGNVRQLSAGEEVAHLCCHPETYDPDTGQLPTEDVIIAQVLALRTNEELFRATANITPVHRYAYEGIAA